MNNYFENYPESELIKGIYFKSENDIESEYIIELSGKNYDNNGVISIYIIDEFTTNFGYENLKIGDDIVISKHNTVLYCSLDLVGKYFSPKFKGDMQLYYDNEKYYNGRYKSDSIKSLMECINYSIEYGLNKYNIKPY